MSKLKLNFATRVASMRTAKSDVSRANDVEKAKVQAAVNGSPVIIDRSVFKKTDIERAELATAKIKWKRAQVK
jgi:hypothetical protein